MEREKRSGWNGEWGGGKGRKWKREGGREGGTERGKGEEERGPVPACCWEGGGGWVWAMDGLITACQMEVVETTRLLEPHEAHTTSLCPWFTSPLLLFYFISGRAYSPWVGVVPLLDFYFSVKMGVAR